MAPTLIGFAAGSQQGDKCKLQHTGTMTPGNPSVRIVPMSGVRCPTCAANGQESWVIPGKTCGYCGTGC